MTTNEISSNHTNNNKFATNMGDVVVPDMFLCPITFEIMIEPMMTRDGFTFDKRAILPWVAQHHTCPLTRKPLNLCDIVRNRSLKGRIDSWCRLYGYPVMNYPEFEDEYEIPVAFQNVLNSISTRTDSDLVRVDRKERQNNRIQRVLIQFHIFKKKTTRIESLVHNS